MNVRSPFLIEEGVGFVIDIAFGRVRNASLPPVPVITGDRDLEDRDDDENDPQEDHPEDGLHRIDLPVADHRTTEETAEKRLISLAEK